MTATKESEAVVMTAIIGQNTSTSSMGTPYLQRFECKSFVRYRSRSFPVAFRAEKICLKKNATATPAGVSYS
jgi:hypothetical protein